MKRFRSILIAGALAFGTLATAQSPELRVDEASFRCITQMTPVRDFYLDNLAGNLEKTLAVARSNNGGAYPLGTVVQLFPGEAMVKMPAGTNAATKDWEFFELAVSAAGTRIVKRGFVDVVNRFGGNCLGCHAEAQSQWDLICEKDHGCKPIGLITRAMTHAIQRADPRCNPPNVLTAEDSAALLQFRQAMAALKAASKP